MCTYVNKKKKPNCVIVQLLIFPPTDFEVCLLAPVTTTIRTNSVRFTCGYIIPIENENLWAIWACGSVAERSKALV